MAEGEEKDFENLKALIACGICKKTLTEPKSLPNCLHTFCFECIRTWIQSRQRTKGAVDCPLCRTTINPSGGVINLLTSFHHNSLIQVYNNCKLQKKNQESKDARVEITQKCNDLRELVNWCMTAVDQTEKTLQKNEKEISQVKDEIRASTSLQVKILEKHEQAMLDQLEAIRTRQKTGLETMRNKLTDHIQEIIELNNKCQELEKDPSIEQLKTERLKQLQDNCRTTIERTKSALSTNQLSPIFYIPNSKVSELLDNFQIGELHEQAVDPSKCSIENAQATRCGFINQFNIVIRDSNGNKCYTDQSLIDVNIQDCDGNDVHKEITESEPGQFTVKHRIAKPLPYKITATVGGKLIQNSPRKVNVIDVKANLMPARFFQTIRASFPVKFAVNDKGDIAIVNNNGGRKCRIVVYSSDGVYVTDFGSRGTGEGQLTKPLGLAFTKDDHILVSDNTDSGACIKEYHISGRLIRTVHKLSRVLFTGMCTAGQNIACLSYSIHSKEASIMLFSKETSAHLQNMSIHAPKRVPRYLAYDNRKYFVTFEDIHSVFVFDENGSLLSTIGDKGDKKGDLYCPHGVTVFGADMFLVCDSGNNRVQVFHQNGAFQIGSFGLSGSGLGQMDGPVDVAVTPDGQVFVLEYAGGRVQVFR